MKSFPKKFSTPKFARAYDLFKEAIQIQNKYNHQVDYALTKYGDHGALISGVIRDHFPKEVKDNLRKLVREKNRLTDLGFAAKPSRVHDKTMTELYQAVKNIIQTKRRKNPVRKNPRLAKKGNTQVTKDNGTVVRLHQTDIVSISASGVIVLNSGGWHTVTTKRRMNETSDEFDLGFRVYAKKGDWYIDTPFDGTIEFFDGVRFQGRPISNPKRKRKVAKKKRSAKQLANDKRLGRMAKARAKKKRGGRRKKVARKKTTRRVARRVVRRNPKRKVAKKLTRRSPFWIVFRCKKASYGTGASIAWLGAGKSGVPKFGPMSHRLFFSSASDATYMAKKHSSAGFYVGVASKTTTSAMLMKYCRDQARGK